MPSCTLSPAANRRAIVRAPGAVCANLRAVLLPLKQINASLRISFQSFPFALDRCVELRLHFVKRELARAIPRFGLGRAERNIARLGVLHDAGARLGPPD